MTSICGPPAHFPRLQPRVGPGSWAKGAKPLVLSRAVLRVIYPNVPPSFLKFSCQSLVCCLPAASVPFGIARPMWCREADSRGGLLGTSTIIRDPVDFPSQSDPLHPLWHELCRESCAVSNPVASFLFSFFSFSFLPFYLIFSQVSLSRLLSRTKKQSACGPVPLLSQKYPDEHWDRLNPRSRT